MLIARGRTGTEHAPTGLRFANLADQPLISDQVLQSPRRRVEKESWLAAPLFFCRLAPMRAMDTSLLCHPPPETDLSAGRYGAMHQAFHIPNRTSWLSINIACQRSAAGANSFLTARVSQPIGRYQTAFITADKQSVAHPFCP